MATKESIPFAHWYHLIEGLQESSQQFYSSVEEAVYKRQIKGVKNSRIVFREGGIFSGKREYLRVCWKEYIFDVCAAPFGNGFFVSWWLGEKPGELKALLFAIPFLGPLLARTFKPMTYYQLDSTLMFQESIHRAVLDVLDQVMHQGGLRVLSELERKPILQDLFKK